MVSMASSRMRLEPFRRKRVEALRQFVGKHYSDDGTREQVPINLIELAVSIYTRHMVARTPRVTAATAYRELRPAASTLALDLNHLIEHEISLGDTLQRAVVDAMFSIGILKVGITSGQRAEIDGYQHDAEQPYADNVSLDDWVHDMSAKRWENCAYMGDRYTLPLDLIQERELFDKKQRDKLKPGDTDRQTFESDGNDRAVELSRGNFTTIESYRDEIELWDLWLPFENLIITVPAPGTMGESDVEPLQVMDWEGPECGPYHALSFSEVPDQVMPLPPVALMMDLHMLANNIFRKLANQVRRQKTVLGVQAEADKDGGRIVEASDGEAIRVDNPNGAKEYKFGGPDNSSMAMFLQSKDLAVWSFGNLDALGGLSPQSDTVGQDRLLASSASQRVNEMRDRTVTFTRDVVRALAWYEWTNPMLDRDLIKTVPGTNVSIQVRFTAEDREGDFQQYNIGIDADSMQHQSPSDQLQTIQQTFAQFVAPYMELMQQQGVTINFKTLFDGIADLSNTQLLKNIIQYTEPSDPSERPTGQPTARHNQTTRRYERVNRPGATRSGKDDVMARLLMGSGVQQSEGASLGRAVG